MSATLVQHLQDLETNNNYYKTKLLVILQEQQNNYDMLMHQLNNTRLEMEHKKDGLVKGTKQEIIEILEHMKLLHETCMKQLVELYTTMADKLYNTSTEIQNINIKSNSGLSIATKEAITQRFNEDITVKIEEAKAQMQKHYDDAYQQLNELYSQYDKEQQTQYDTYQQNKMMYKYEQIIKLFTRNQRKTIADLQQFIHDQADMGLYEVSYYIQQQKQANHNHLINRLQQCIQIYERTLAEQDTFMQKLHDQKEQYKKKLHEKINQLKHIEASLTYTP